MASLSACFSTSTLSRIDVCFSFMQSLPSVSSMREELRLELRCPLVMRFHPDVRLLEFTTEEYESYYGYVDHCADEPSSFRPFAVQLYNTVEATTSSPAAERA